MYVCHLRFVDDKLLIVWQWDRDSEVEHSEDNSESASSSESASQSSLHVIAESDLESDLESEERAETTVAFKCIGVTRDVSYQNLLREIKERLDKNEHVSMKLTPDPSNPFDSMAIAFQCLHGAMWQTIGYIVKEALGEVHDAIHDGKIISVELAWVKYKLWGKVLDITQPSI